jgi:putative peptide zinc metalloprotease protein
LLHFGARKDDVNETTLKIVEPETDRENGFSKLPLNGDQAGSPIGNLTTLPARSPDLQIRDLGNGHYVVKAPQTADFLQLGEEEHFLLTQLNGENDANAIRSRYADRFGQSLSLEDLEGFLELAREQHLLYCGVPSQGSSLTGATGREALGNPASAGHNTLLYWRKNICDPDSLFAWMAPRIRFFWTRTFLALSAAMIAFAVVLIWANRHELAHSFGDLFRWETLVLAWVTFLLVSVLHEFAHGLTCKRFGGEVHEVGILIMFLMPCLYCDVSSAWMFPEKSKRMWVMFAGVYFELFLWALAAIVWRLTLPHTLCNDIALVVLSLCGLQTLLNLVPFIKLDGYFLLSDWLEIPNLRQRAMEYQGAQLKWLFLGAERPEREPRGWLLTAFGFLCWIFSIVVVALVVTGLTRYAGPHFGPFVLIAIAVAILFCSRIIWKRLTKKEVGMKAFLRSRKLGIWSLLILALGLALRYVEVEDRVGGSFEIRPTIRAELRAAETGFLAEILVQEGDLVSRGQTIARLEIPDLESRMKRKRLEADEVAARLQLLKAGTRPEEIAEQRLRVVRAREWRNLAAEQLDRDRQALAAELERLEHQCQQYQVEAKTADDSLQRIESLHHSGAMTEQELEEARRRSDVALSQWKQAQAQHLLRKALGTRETLSGLDAHSELISRENELADLEAELRLMEEGTRNEEIEAERARLARLREEEQHLKQVASRLVIQSPVSGVVITPRLREKCGQYVQRGELICIVDDPCRLEIEIQLKEQDVSATEVGQTVELRARAFPREVFQTRLSRRAPTASLGEVQSAVFVYCDLENTSAELRTGMTGFARVYTGRRPLGEIAADRVVRFFRTQYWFWPW